MASKIEDKNFYVGVTPYEHEGQTYDVLNVGAGYRKGRGFYANIHAGWKTDWGGYGCTFDFSGNPLSDTIWVDVKEATKNSQKTIDEMYAGLQQAKEHIAYLFDKRNWTELKRLMKDVALCGYTYTIEERMKELRRYPNGSTTSESETNISNNEETMAKNVNAQDYVGKVLVLSDGKSKYVIKSVDGDKLAAEFSRGEGAAANVSLTVAQVESMISAGKAAWSDDVVQGSKVQGSSETVEEVEEVSAITPTKPVAQTVDMKPTTKPKPKNEKPKGEKKGETKGVEKPASDNGKTKSTLKYETYQNKKGKTCARIVGFREDDAAYQQAAELHGSATYETKKGEKVYLLIFGPRYAEAAKEVWRTLDMGGTLEQAKAIIDRATEARAQQREEWKARRAERSASQPAAETKQGYSDKDVAEMLKKIMAGEAIPENIKAAMAA